MIQRATIFPETPRASLAGRLVRCQVGGRPFALPLERVVEVVALGTATATAPRGWIGTLLRNERPVPIGDLAFLLGLPPAQVARRDVRAMILRGAAGNPPFGVTVETVPKVLDIGEARPEPMPPSAWRGAGELVRGSLVYDDALLLLLDADAIIARLAGGVTRAPDGRISELRALPRRFGGESGTVGDGRPRLLRTPARDLPALLVTRTETADGGSGFVPAVPMTWIQEVRPWEEPRPLPHAPAALIGLATWRGRTLPVVDLVQRLTGIPSTTLGAGKRRLLIVGPQGQAPLGALLVPGVLGLRTLVADPPGDAHAMPETLDPALLSAWTHHDADAVAVLDLAAFFA